MNVSLREALIASGQIKPQGMDAPITGGVLLGLNGKPRLGDIRGTYMQNPSKSGHKNSEGKTTPPKKEKHIMSTASENKTESTNSNKGRGKAAESNEIDMGLVMESVNKSHETHALINTLLSLSQLESGRSDALVHKIEAQSVRLDQLALVIGKNATLVTETINSLPKPKRDLVADAGMFAGAFAGGFAAHQLLKVSPAASTTAVAAQESLGLTYAVSAGVGGLVGRSTAKLGEAAVRKVGGWYSKRKAAAAPKTTGNKKKDE